jgi:flagellar biosynthesis protein FliR
LTPALANAHSADGIAFVIALVVETGIGAAIGFAASILYDGAYAGGRMLDDYVGIKSAVPNAQVFAPSGFGRIWSLVFTAGFFVLGAYRYVILVFANSFDRLPPGALVSAHDLYSYGIGLPVAIVEAALLVAGPAIALAFVVQFALGSLARVIPRFASFTLSFPLVFGAVLVATFVAVPLLYGQSAHPWMRIPFLGTTP